MATTSNTTHLPPPLVTISSTILYGVFATEKSLLIGTRSLERLEYANMLVHKAVDGRLPQELIDLIIDQFHDMDHPIVQGQWRPGIPILINRIKFIGPGVGMAHQRAAQQMIRSLGVRVTKVTVSKPTTSVSEEESKDTNYVHLAATKCRPTLSLSLPSSSKNFPFGVHHTGSKGHAVTDLLPNDPNHRGTNEDCLVYTPDSRMTTTERGAKRPFQLGKLIECEGVEDALRDWDAEAVRKLVELLGLKIVPFDERDPMRPGLHIWQQVRDL